MSYMALARKWRPRTFSQMLGQNHINKALMNALDQQRLHHAYLFTGTRGVGKTSVARILAKALNCEKGISSEPCLVCDTCLAIEQGRFMDLIEIDGASKTRVEDTRELLENIHYAPASGRFKIYLIDEVHMLSQHSFNALLKTLEEPPEHVKFILATTDPQKVPVTVLSRCLQFNLKHLSDSVICQHLQYILDDEQFHYEVKALELIAHAARGSMRDALSLLDQAVTSCSEQLQAHDVKTILGYTSQDYAIQLLAALAEQNPSQLITLNQNIATEGEHFHYVLDEMLNYLHQIAIYQSIGDSNPLISPNSETKMLSEQFSPEDVQLFYQIALKGREELYLAPTLSIGFSMTMLRMLTFKPAVNTSTPPLAFENPEPEKKKEPIETLQPAQAQPTKEIVINSVPNLAPQQEVAADFINESNTLTILPEHWTETIPKLNLAGFALNAIENSEFVQKNGREVTLRVAKGHQSLFTPSTISRIEAALSELYKAPIKLILNSDETVLASPAQQKTQITIQKQQDAESALNNDPLFQQLKQDFSAELVKNSIVPLKNDL